MADKNIQIKDANGNNLFPKTKAAVVFNNSNANLGTVEAGAQVNKIEKIKVNGVELSIVAKEADITVPEYSISKLATAESGFAASYQLTKGGTAVGATINIPKDMVVQSGSVKTVTVAGQPVSGYAVGDKYIDLVLANATNSHIYILVSDLVDVYTAGSGISISGGQVAVDTAVVALKSDLNGYQTSLSAAQLDAVNSGITTDKVSTYDGYAAAIAGKAAKATTLAGYGITDGLTFEELA